MRFVDLSVSFDDNKHWAPIWARNKVKYINHKLGGFIIRILYGLAPRYLRNGLGWAIETIKLSTHGTTHLDAPWHFSPISEGKPAKTIDLVPLEWCFSNGVMLDFSGKNNGEVITVTDVKHALSEINYEIKPFDIVLARTGNDRMFGTRDYFYRGVGVSAEATRWILDHGVKVVGIDSWGWDAPLPDQAKRARETGDNSVFWAAHYVGIDVEYCHLEQLANLDKLPSTGFKVCCFPLKVKSGSAGPARVVALIDE